MSDPEFGFNHEPEDTLASNPLAYEALRMFQLAGEAETGELQMQAAHLMSVLFDVDKRAMTAVHEKLSTSEKPTHRAIGALTLRAALPHDHARVVERWADLLGDPARRVGKLAGHELESAMRSRSGIDEVNLQRIATKARRAVVGRTQEDTTFQRIDIEEFLYKWLDWTHEDLED